MGAAKNIIEKSMNVSRTLIEKQNKLYQLV